jgi:uncharacterized OB-fold protein
MNSPSRNPDTDQRANAGPEGQWLTALADGRLTYQVCGDCESVIFYPRLVCPNCGSDELSSRDSSGVGTVYSATAVHTRTGTHSVVLVDLDEGFRMMSSVRGIDPDAVPIGLRVSLDIITEGDRPLPVFRALETPHQTVADSATTREGTHA